MRRKRNVKDNKEEFKISNLKNERVIIVTSTNKNKTYCEFVPSVYQMWKKFLPNCIFALAVISNKSEDDLFIRKLRKFSDDFYLFKNHENIDSGVQAKVSRLYLSSLYGEDPVIIVDVDQYVFNFDWLMESLRPIFEGKFVSIGYNAYVKTDHKGKWPMPYTSGSSNIFKKLIRYKDTYDTWLNSLKVIDDPIDKLECVSNSFNNYSDESTLRYLVDKYPDREYIKNIWVKVDRKDAVVINVAHRRIDRWNWNKQFSTEKLNNGYFLDCWPLRPFRANFEKIKPFLELLELDISNEKMFLEDCKIYTNKDIENQIRVRQYERNMDDCLFLIADLESGGFGAMVARRKLVYQIAHEFNRTVLFKYNGMIYDECYENYCQFSLEEVMKKYDNKVTEFNFSYNQPSKLCYFNFNKYWNSKQKAFFQTWNDPCYDKSYLFFSGLILSQFQLKKEYRECISGVEKELDFSKKTIGLHVRRGDKGIETGKLNYVSLEAYMKEVNKIREKTNINRVFVCSDSKKVFGELKEKYKDYEFIQDDKEIRYDNANHSMVNANKDLKKQETITGIKIIELLSSCEYVIGQHDTQFSKLAGSILSYKKNENRLVLINYENNKVVNFGINSKTS